VPVIVGDERRAVEMSEQLLRRGFLLRAIRYPAVPKGSARLRLTVSLKHSEEDLRELADTLMELSTTASGNSP
jgi:7-keto-8-aminopelargonate synthetase-like enzyme